MFDDRTGRPIGRIEFADQFKGRIGVVDIVIRQFFTLMLGRRSNTGTCRAIGVEGRLLVGVLAVAQGLRQRAAHGTTTRGVPDLRGHPCADSRVIGRRAGIGRLRQTLAQRIGGLPVILGQFVDHCRIIFDIDDHIHKTVVLRGRADHRRATDIDILDHLGIFRPFGDGFFKGIQVHHNQIDRANVMFVHRRDMFVIVTQRQQPTVHDGVQRLDPPVHHLGEAGDLGHILDLQTCVAQRLGGAAGAQQFDPMRRERLPQLDQTGLVRYGKKRAGDGVKIRHRGGSFGQSWSSYGSSSDKSRTPIAVSCALDKDHLTLLA